MDKKLKQWRESGKHLPEFLRDFHDQKDFFKFLHEYNDPKEMDMIKDIDWVKGQIYVIDVFLWTLARHGWTLQKNRSNQKFDDLDKMVNDFTQNRNDMFTQILAQQMSKNKKDENED